MIRRNSIVTTILLIIGIGILIAGFIGGNYRFTRSNPGGEQFFVNWYSARSLFIDGINPYSETAQVNLHTYADVVVQVKLEPGTQFEVPLYSAFITLPFAIIEEFAMARAVWMSLLELAVIGLVLMSLSLARWKVKPVTLGIILIFGWFWFHGLYPIVSGSMSILVAVAIAGVFMAVRARQYEFAGVLLGIATILPHTMIFFAAFVVVWSFRYRQAKMAAWFFSAIILLSGMAALIRPQWIVDYLRAIINPGPTVYTISQVLQSFLPAAGQRLGLLLSGFVLVITFFEWFVSKKTDFPGFYWTGLLALTLTPWIGLPTDPAGYIVSFPAIIWAICLWNERWERAGIALTIGAVLILFGGIWLIFLNNADIPVSEISGLFFAQPLVVGIMLYWVRWWAIRKPNVWFDQIS